MFPWNCQKTCLGLWVTPPKKNPQFPIIKPKLACGPLFAVAEVSDTRRLIHEQSIDVNAKVDDSAASDLTEQSHKAEEEKGLAFEPLEPLGYFTAEPYENALDENPGKHSEEWADSRIRLDKGRTRTHYWDRHQVEWEGQSDRELADDALHGVLPRKDGREDGDGEQQVAQVDAQVEGRIAVG